MSTLEQPLAVPDPGGPPSPQYPAQLEIAYPPELNRWLPLVKWLLVIPHFFVLFFLAIGAWFVIIFAFFAVLFTGRFPRGAFDYLVGVQRWSYRVSAYYMLMVDPYPPFSLDDDPNYPVRLDIEYPEHVANWRPLVHWLLFTILFTKKIPRGMFDLMVPGMRWQLRANIYSYWMTERYPPWIWG